MVGNEHLKKTGFWEVPEKAIKTALSIVTAPQHGTFSQNEKRTAEWLRQEWLKKECLTDSKALQVSQEKVTKE